MLKAPPRKDILGFQILVSINLMLGIALASIGFTTITTLTSRIEFLESQLTDQIDKQSAKQAEVESVLEQVIDFEGAD